MVEFLLHDKLIIRWPHLCVKALYRDIDRWIYYRYWYLMAMLCYYMLMMMTKVMSLWISTNNSLIFTADVQLRLCYYYNCTHGYGCAGSLVVTVLDCHFGGPSLIPGHGWSFRPRRCGHLHRPRWRYLCSGAGWPPEAETQLHLSGWLQAAWKPLSPLESRVSRWTSIGAVSYTHLTLPTNREV